MFCVILLCDGLFYDCSIFFSMLGKGLLVMFEGYSSVRVGDWVDPVSGFRVGGCVLLVDGGVIVGVFGLGVVGLENVERSCQMVGLLEACWGEAFYVWFAK